jgi:hypothetical protein
MVNKFSEYQIDDCLPRRSANCTWVRIFFACLDLEPKFSLIIRLIDRKEVYDEVRNFFHRYGPHSSFDHL